MKISGKILKNTVLVIFCVLIGFAMLISRVSAEIVPPLRVHAEMKVEWNFTQKDMRYEGRLNVNAYGIMERTYGKGKPKEGPASDAVMMYLPQSMSILYSYNEKETFLGPVHPDRCKTRLRKKVFGRLSSEEPRGATLSINRMSSLTDALVKNISPQGKEFASQLLQFYQREPDSLTLTIKGPAEARMSEKLKGFRIQAGKVCKTESYEKTVPLFAIGLHLKLPESGSVQGKHEWSTDGKGVPTYFDASVSDIGGTIEEKPVENGSGVNYLVSWNIGEDVKQPWKDSGDDCEKIRDRIRWIDKIIETYEDEGLRNLVKGTHGENATKEYQEQIEREVSEAFPGEDGKPAEISSDFQTDPHCKGACGPGQNAPTIDGQIEGESFNIMVFDSGGNLIWQDEALMDYYRAQNDFFDGLMDHEKQHVEDFTSKGYPDTIDELADFEIRGYRKELEDCKSKLVENDCEPIF